MDIRHKNSLLGSILCLALLVISIASVYAVPLDPHAQGQISSTATEDYLTLMNELTSDDRVLTTFDNKLWVPWYSSSSSCELYDLQSGVNCLASTIDGTHNCMVTDELSQVGILLAMGNDQHKMNQFYNTLFSIKSAYGDLPSWRIYRDGNTIKPCEPGINGACDTASDASARIIQALFIASQNNDFYDGNMKQHYRNLALKLTEDFLKYEVVNECHKTTFGKDVCYWLASGSGAKTGGMSSIHFGYTGYYPDAAIALLAACSATSDERYCNIAKDLVYNYLQASYPEGTSLDNGFRVPPGMAFSWDLSGSTPRAKCTRSCEPQQWDDADAPRALGMCQVLYYADHMGYDMGHLSSYCSKLNAWHLQNPYEVHLQFADWGGATQTVQKSFFAQGLQSLAYLGINHAKFRTSLHEALGHYTPSMGTWDYSSCFGVYKQTFPLRALGTGIGRDLNAFSQGLRSTGTTELFAAASSDSNGDTGFQTTQNTDSSQTSTVAMTMDLQTRTPDTPTGEYNWNIYSLPVTCSKDLSCSLRWDTISGDCRTTRLASRYGDIQVKSCAKGDSQEVYRQEWPWSADSSDSRVCFGDTCVNKERGFAKSTLQNTLNDDFGTEQFVDTSIQATSSNFDVHSLSPQCDGGCWLKEDVAHDTCRTLRFDSHYGSVKVLACEKSGGVELYRQDWPSNAPLTVCLGNACVDSLAGFART